ncbi:MAG: glycosyltransferase, partial [Mariprofundales bacterium]|nr:glycosyltransferase [Mariprofundales bacterium]
MKLAYFAFDIFAPSNTAGFVHTFEISQCLARKHTLKLYTIPPPRRILHLHRWNTIINQLPVEYVRFTLWFKPYLIPLLPLNAVSYHRVSRQLASFKPELVHERFHTPNPFGWRLARKHSLPRVLEVNSLYIEDGTYRNPVFNRIAELDRTAQFQHADALITQTETLRKLLAELSDAPTYVVANGVNTQHFTPNIDTMQLRRELGIPVDSVVVTFSGSFRDWHGVHLVPEIAEKI